MFWGVLRDALPLVPIALALVWTLRYQKIADFSLAGSFSAAAGVVAFLVERDLPPILAVGVGLLVGLAVALLMSLSIHVLKLEALLASVVVLFIVYALSLWVTQGTITIEDRANPLEVVRSFERSHGWSETSLLETALFLVVVILCIWATDRLLTSEWGSAFRALEDSNGGWTFLESLGISPAYLSAAGLCFGGMLAALSGVIVAFRDGQATSSLGLDVLIEIVPAYLLGLALFESRPRQESDTKVPRSVFRLGLLLRQARFARSSLAASLGVVTFFVILNLALQWVRIESLPRVFIGVSILLLLGVRPALYSFRHRLAQVNATKAVGPESPLRVKNLSVVFPTLEGPRTIIHDSSFEVPPGKIAKIQGVNGVGKTTALRALAGLIESTGHFEIPASASEVALHYRRMLVSYVSQDARETTVSTLTVAEHAVLCQRGSRVSPFRKWKRNANLAVSRLRFEAARRNSMALVGWLSGGERRNLLLGLLSLQANLPRVVCFDEPFAYLDTSGQEECRQLIREIASQGRVILVVDHQNNLNPGIVISASPGAHGANLLVQESVVKKGGPQMPEFV